MSPRADRGDEISTNSENRLVLLGFDPASAVPSGIGRYTRELFSAMAAAPPHAGCIIARVSVEDWRRAATARAWALGLGGSQRDSALPTSLHATSVLAPPRRKQPLVTTIHDLVAFTHPETLTPHGARWHRRMITRAVTHADAIVVPTQAVAEQLVTAFQEQATGLRQRIHVIGGAPSLVPASKSEGDRSIAHLELPSGPFVVFVGTREPRKGLDLLIPAVARFPDLSLVLVGPGGWGTLNIQKISQKSGMELSGTNKRLFVTGVLDDIALATVIERAQTLVMPSRAEGFGLPLVEAMHLGTPVVHSSDPALVEVAGGAGISFELDASGSKNIGLLSAAIVDAAENRHSLRAAGMQRAQAFSWGESARRIWDIHLNL